MLLTNPVVLSVLLMCVLCLLRFNVFLAILISALAAGMLAGKGLVETTNLLISGMQGNLETALSYILLGALAAAISMTNLTPILIHYVSKFISKKVFLVFFEYSFYSMFFSKSHTSSYSFYTYLDTTLACFDE